MANTDQDALEQFRAILSETSDVNGVGRVEFYGDDPTEPRMVMPLTRLRRVDRAAQAEALRKAADVIIATNGALHAAGVHTWLEGLAPVVHRLEEDDPPAEPQADTDPALLPQGTVIRAVVTGVGVIVAEKITGTEWQTTRGDWVSSKDLQRIRVLDAPDMKRPTPETPAAEASAPERDRKADLVVEISDSVARDAEQLADMLHREGAGDDVAAAVASLAGYLADLAKDVKALAAIVAERGQS